MLKDVKSFNSINYKTQLNVNFKKMNSKKLLLYGSGALGLGAITFFVWSFFQKTKIPLSQSTVVKIGSNQTTDNSTEDSSDSNSNFSGANKKNSLSELDKFISKGI